MRKLLDSRWFVGIGLALLCPVAFAMQLEERQLLVGQIAIAAFVLVGLAAGALVCFRGVPDKRELPLKQILNAAQAIHSVEADTLVVDCVRRMTDNKIGSLIVTDGGKLTGIFTERDAMNRVLANGRDPRETRVFEVMTPNPHWVSPDTTIGAAMELVTQKHFRHLPIVQDGKVQALLSSRDLTDALSGREPSAKLVSIPNLLGTRARSLSHGSQASPESAH